MALAELLSATHNGSFGAAAMPQAFCRFGSTRLGWREVLLAMRLVRVKLLAGADEATAGSAAATRPAAATHTMRVDCHFLPRAGL